MSNITLRFVHRQSRTPVLELEVAASATVGALRELLMERLASEEACMMRVVVKWHAQIALPGGQKRLIELTDEDECEPLDSHGISHLSEVHLEGPLTGDSEGLGQALGSLSAQVRTGFGRLHTMLSAVLEGQRTLLLEVSQYSAACCHYLLLPNAAFEAVRGLGDEEAMAFARLRLLYEAEAGCHKVFAEDTAAQNKMRASWRFTIDGNTPHTTFTISDDGTTAAKTSGLAERFATFRTFKPLTAVTHKFAVKILHHGWQIEHIIIGLLPKLSNAQVAQMEGDNYWYTGLGSRALGGWGMNGNGTTYGDWECPQFVFRYDDVVICDLNFAAKTLTLSCGDRKAVGTIPSIKEGDELYPAVTMWDSRHKVAFVATLF